MTSIHMSFILTFNTLVVHAQKMRILRRPTTRGARYGMWIHHMSAFWLPVTLDQLKHLLRCRDLAVLVLFSFSALMRIVSTVINTVDIYDHVLVRCRALILNKFGALEIVAWKCDVIIRFAICGAPPLTRVRECTLLKNIYNLSKMQNLF